MKTDINSLHGDERMDAIIREGEPVVMSKIKLLVIVLVAVLTGMCLGGALMLEYVPWILSRGQHV
ncbi:hypothetical protein NFI00_000021 [Salmonella enterica]|nr:hypothetical protein [Salmonella enterica]